MVFACLFSAKWLLDILLNFAFVSILGNLIVDCSEIIAILIIWFIALLIHILMFAWTIDPVCLTWAKVLCFCQPSRGSWLCTRPCLCVISFCKQDIAKTMYLCKIYSSHSLCTVWELLAFGAHHIQHGWEQVAQDLKFLHGPFPEQRNRHPVANHVIAIVHHGSW